MNNELAAAVAEASQLLDDYARPCGDLYIRLQLLEASRRHAVKAVGEAEEDAILRVLRLLRQDIESVRGRLNAFKG